jgi:hypothetical protein
MGGAAYAPSPGVLGGIALHGLSQALQFPFAQPTLQDVSRFGSSFSDYVGLASFGKGWWNEAMRSAVLTTAVLSGSTQLLGLRNHVLFHEDECNNPSGGCDRGMVWGGRALFASSFLFGGIVGGLEVGGTRLAAAGEVAVEEAATGIVEVAAEGTATVFQHGTRHMSVLVEAGGTSLHTEQILTSAGTTIAERGAIGGATNSVTVPLPNANAALGYQRGVLGTATGPYNLGTNSCVTHCGDVLRAGGVSGVPTTTRALIPWFRGLLGGP